MQIAALMMSLLLHRCLLMLHLQDSTQMALELGKLGLVDFSTKLTLLIIEASFTQI
jgi:hypothetical protein